MLRQVSSRFLAKATVVAPFFRSTKKAKSSFRVQPLDAAVIVRPSRVDVAA